MPGKESQPGVIESASYTLRNVEIVVAAIATYFAAYGIAALSAIGAVIDHGVGDYFKKRRLKTA